jgi:hypothetical protein
LQSVGPNVDPHFVVWSGHRFDFHGGCDLVLIQNPTFNNGQGLYIHIRTKIDRWWSYVESVVTQIGPDTLKSKEAWKTTSNTGSSTVHAVPCRLVACPIS